MININNCIDLTDIPFEEWRTKYIGSGYRYCCYKTRNDETEEEKRHPKYTDGKRVYKTHGWIYFLGYDIKGNPCNFIYKHKSHIYYNVDFKTDIKDIFGRYVDVKYFNTTAERAEYLKHCVGLNVIECMKPENEFLHMVFDDVALEENFNTQKQRIFFYDIETEIGDTFEYAKTANQRINALTIYDTLTEKYYIWSLNTVNLDFSDEYDEEGNLINECPLKDVPKEKFVVFDFFCNHEPAMFRHLLDWWEENYPDVLCGFNSQGFDDVYLINRIERVLGDKDNVDGGSKTLSKITKRLSPVGNITIRSNNRDDERANKGAEQISNIDGIFQADLLLLFRDKFKIDQPLDGGNSLDNIGEVKCGIHKIHYKNLHIKGHPIVYSLKELYEKDWDRFIKYNVMDVEVLRRVEDVVKTIPLSRTIVSAGLCNYDTIYSSISYLIGSLSMFSKTQMGTIMTSYNQNKPQQVKIEGAFVFPPQSGLYNGGICTIDFSSLYPSIIRALNISIETYVGKISRFPIEDNTSELFVSEPPIDLNGTDIIDSGRLTENENEYNDKYKNRFTINDKDIDKFYLLPANGGKQKVISRAQLDELLKTKCIFTRNNTLLLKHSVKQGVISGWCRHFYSLRKQTKKKMASFERELYENKITEQDNINNTKILIENLNSRQQSLKILINSCYGILGSYYGVYQPYLAQTITRQGKYCNLSTSEYINNLFNTKYGDKNSILLYIDKNGNKKTTYSVSGDTDSSVYHKKIRIFR